MVINEQKHYVNNKQFLEPSPIWKEKVKEVESDQ